MPTIVSFEEHETALNPEHCNFGDEGNIQCTPIVVAVCEGFKLSRMKQKKEGKGVLDRQYTGGINILQSQIDVDSPK